MFRSIRIGRFWGIDVFVHSTFFILLLFGVNEWWEAKALGATNLEALNSAGNVLALVGAIFVCVVLHEYGHALTARAFGIGTVDITLLPIGGVARLERIPERPRQEFLVAIAGPAVNAVIVLIILALFGISKMLHLHGFAQQRGDLLHKLMVWADFSKQLLLANLAMIIFNAIPAFPMDGGRVLRAILATRIDRVRATKIAVRIGKVLAVVMAGYGIYSKHYLLIATAVFVWVGASREEEAVIEDAQASQPQL